MLENKLTQYPHLMQSLSLRGHVLKNRVVFGAHTANMSDDGLPGPRYGAYLLERALGGTGMIVAEPMPVHRTGVLTRGNFRHSSDDVITPFKKIVEPIKATGTVILQQLYHIGAHGDSDLSFQPHWSPSGAPSYHDSDGSHAVTETEIYELIDAHVTAAIRCKKAGFQGVEVWAAYHSLLDQFWTPWSNQRTDQWGGSLENRTRFSRMIIDGIRCACGDGFIIGLAVSISDVSKVLLTLEQLKEIVALHDATGQIDYVTCGHGGYLDFERLMPTFLFGEKLTAPATEQLKSICKHAFVTSEVQVRTPENGEAILASRQADMVSIVRGQIADPHLVNKALTGSENDIRGCISCNQMCWGRRSRDYWISCLINPSVGREFEWGGDRFTRALQFKKVLVIGAGPAGLEAARSAAERGHNVTLVEAGSKIGGQFRLAGLVPRRSQITDLLKWYERQLAQLGVRIHLNTFFEDADVESCDADHIVIATGSLPDPKARQRWLPDLGALPGLDLGMVFAPEEVLRREMRLGDTVVVYDEGGNWRGAGTAWYLAEAGKSVILVTPDAFVGKELERTSADAPLRRRLACAGVQVFCEHGIARWHGNRVTLHNFLTQTEHSLPASALVMATTNQSFDIFKEVFDKKTTYRIGDAAAPRQAPYAFYEGRQLGMSL